MLSITQFMNHDAQPLTVSESGIRCAGQFNPCSRTHGAKLDHWHNEISGAWRATRYGRELPRPKLWRGEVTYYSKLPGLSAWRLGPGASRKPDLECPALRLSPKLRFLS